MGELLTIENGIALLTLTLLEIVLGIDNIVFIAILTGKLKPEQQHKARRAGLAMAMISRIALLLAISWVMQLTTPLFSVASQQISGRDIILLVGGLFLLGKSVHEIHDAMGGEDLEGVEARQVRSVGSAVFQIMILDIVFSLDSVITAVGMAQHVWVMIAAIIIAVAIMMVFADSVSRFIEKRPTVRMLALSFLLLIGVMLVAEALGRHIPKGYIYFAMGFSLLVEVLNQRAQNKRKRPPDSSRALKAASS